MPPSTFPSVSTEYTYRGIDTAFLENRHLRIQILTGKGGDIVEFRDKRAGENLLWQADHNWVPPSERYLPSETSTTWLDHYPGGWQVNLPVAGFGRDIPGNAYGLHGESALVPWDVDVLRDDDEAVTLTLSTELVRYPFYVERELTLPAEEPRLELTTSITNRGEVELEYAWQHHIALGAPLVGPPAEFTLPAERGVVEEYGDDFPNARLESGEEFEWPHAPGQDGETVDLREFPPYDAEIHDLAFATELREGWYAVTNPDIDLGFTFEFPLDPFETVWYWQPFGGFHESPYFNRNYNAGIEPTTAYPSAPLPEAQRETGTMKTLAPGASVEATFRARTFCDVASTNVDDVVHREHD